MASGDDEYDGSSTESEYYEGVDYEALGCVDAEGADVMRHADDAATVDSTANAEAKGSHQSSPRSAASLHDAHSEKQSSMESGPVMNIVVEDSKPHVVPGIHEPEPEARHSCEDFGRSASQLHDQDHNDSVEVPTPATPAAPATGASTRRRTLGRKRRKIICTSHYAAQKRRIKRSMQAADPPSNT